MYLFHLPFYQKCAILFLKNSVRRRSVANILITGGAGFLGLNIATELIKNGNDIIIIDDLKNSYVAHIKSLIKKHKKHIRFYKGDVCNKNEMRPVFTENKIDYVLHLAALKYVAESIRKPKKYRENNIGALNTILDLAEEFNIKKFAFSSTSVVYGNAKEKPFDENSPIAGLNPYAKTKCEGEQIIEKWQKQSGISTIIFRFTNPVGANDEYMLGDHSKRKQMQLIPYIVNCALNNKEIVLRGNNFNTPDGTPVRSYFHVTDLARAVATALANFNKKFEIYNVGNPRLELSTKQIVTKLKEILGDNVRYSFSKANSQENAIISCDCDKFRKEFTFECKKTLDDILLSQINFEKYISSHFKN